MENIIKKVIISPENPNGIYVDMTEDEIAFKNNSISKELEKRNNLKTIETAKATAQASGNQKLLDLGLTQVEATALTGYTPPVEE
jgi:hypothetical protein